MNMLKVLEAHGRVGARMPKHLKRIDRRLAYEFTNWEEEEIQTNLAKERPRTVWQQQKLDKRSQKMRQEERQICWKILREDIILPLLLY